MLKSDIIQTVNLDVIDAYIKSQNNIIENIEEIMSIQEFNQIKELLGENITKNISSNYYNELYINYYLKKLYTISKYSRFYREKLNNVVGSGQSKNIDAYKNYNIFDDQKLVNQYFIENSNDIKTNDENSSYFFSERGFGYQAGLNSNIISLGLSNKILEKKHTDSLVKICVKIVDLENIHHLYLPKVYLFSTAISSNKSLNDIIREEGDTNSIKDLLFCNSNVSIDSLNKVTSFNPDDFRLAVSGMDETPSNFDSVFTRAHPLYVLINRLIRKNRINITSLLHNGEIMSGENAISILCNHILNCHLNSKYVGNMSRILTGINVPSTENNSFIHRDFLNIVNQIPNDLFKNIFNVEKNQFVSSYQIDSKNDLFKQSIYDFKNKNPSLFLENISNICPINNLYIDEYYDIYNIVLNQSDFVFFDLNRLNQNNTDSLFYPATPNSAREGINTTMLNSVLLSNFSSMNFEGLMSNFEMQYFLKNLTTDNDITKNYKIYVEGEVI